jgi:hypothetical protein
MTDFELYEIAPYMASPEYQAQRKALEKAQNSLTGQICGIILNGALFVAIGYVLSQFGWPA